MRGRVPRALVDGRSGAEASGTGDALPPVDPARLGALGHSFGGWTAIKLAALEPRLRAVCGLAPVAEPFVGRRAFADGELPLPSGVRSLVLAARDDVLVDLDTSIRPLFERLGPGARLEIIDDADHFHFCDGIGLLHRMHEANPREGQPRPTRPFAELQPEDAMHALLSGRVTRFFADTIGTDATPCAGRDTRPDGARRGPGRNGGADAVRVRAAEARGVAGASDSSGRGRAQAEARSGVGRPKSQP